MPGQQKASLRLRWLMRTFALCLLAAAGVTPASTGGKPLIAIIVYTGASGPAYVQAYDIALNGKNEVYLCPAGGAAIDLSNYKKQPKVKLGGADWIERRPDGVLTIKVLAAVQCFVPENLKLEKNHTYTPAELASMAVLQGKLLAKSSNGDDGVPGEIKPGTFIRFVPESDAEMAEYLRASRYATIPLWTDYLLRYPAASHSDEAKRALAGLITDEAEKDYSAFQASPVAARDFARLRSARDRALQALKVLPQFPRADKLAFDIRTQVNGQLDHARGELNAYQQSINDHTAGYSHLLSANAYLANAHAVEPELKGYGELKASADTLSAAIESALTASEALVSQGRFDDACNGISRYREFRGELPRVAAILEAAFNFHRKRGDDAVAASDWELAIAEFKRALALRQDTATTAALGSAETQLHALRTREGADRALADSRILSDAEQYFEAYQLLDKLPPEQRALVGEEMKALQKPYADELLKRADALLRVHLPIRGRADEDAARTAESYLKENAALTSEDMVKVKLDLVDERIAAYYFDLAQKQFAKPRGLGSGLGWMYLKEAQRYKPDLPSLSDMLTRYEPQYDTRAKLSIAVAVRDHTSRRDSLGYADQVADTIAAALDSAKLPGVKVMSRRNAATDAAVDPNAYLPIVVLTGDILDHRVDRKVDTEGMASHYRSGRREVRNPAWVVAKENYDTLKADVAHAREFQLARAASLKKKELADSQQQIDELAKKADDARKKLDAIPETQLEDVILPYNYTKRTVTLKAVVSIGFQVLDPENENVRDGGTIQSEQPAAFVVLENVKSEDVDGVIAAGNIPDEIQLLADAEHKAQVALVDDVIKKVRALPAKILADARARAQQNDLEGTAEEYILYLNSTQAADSPERSEAAGFLRKEFNLTWTPQ